MTRGHNSTWNSDPSIYLLPIELRLKKVSKFNRVIKIQQLRKVTIQQKLYWVLTPGRYSIEGSKFYLTQTLDRSYITSFNNSYGKVDLNFDQTQISKRSICDLTNIPMCFGRLVPSHLWLGDVVQCWDQIISERAVVFRNLNIEYPCVLFMYLFTMFSCLWNNYCM